MTTPIVDVHCHNFNADDLPVRGFVQHVALHDSVISPAVAGLLDVIVQQGAPGYAEEKPRLDSLLGSSTFDDALEGVLPAPPTVDPLDQLEREVDAELVELQARNPELAFRAAQDLAADDVRAAGDEEGPIDLARALRRGVKWAKLFTKSRLDLAGVLTSTYPDVDLFCPMLVDLGAALGDSAKTTIRQQVILQEKISRLSMLGLLPWRTGARIHPFVGFDPRHEVRARRARDIETPLDVAKDAVHRFGFVGVKVYPPMGFRPINNVPVGDVNAAEAAELNEVLADLYSWCETEQVPITAHCNNSQYASTAYEQAGLAGPGGWIEALEKYEGLHLNLGHFGGANPAEQQSAWIYQIAAAATRFDFLFADTGNHKIYDKGISQPYLNRLQKMFSDNTTRTMQRRLMYGTDWFMLAIYPDWEKFLSTYRDLYRAKFDAAATDAFLGGNALRFLGFGDPTNKNNRRLWQRYQTYAPNQLPDWLAEPTPETV
ncbi:amidohydrolase family protein [Kribbella qitaiheensis]|nr:amidohydrolase family protein [Kribbella qitaiheensis]